MIKIKQFYLNELRECCYILSDETGECVIADPGISSQSERDRIVKYISDNNLKPVKLICTHGHFDHVMGSAFIADKYGIKMYISKKDISLVRDAVRNSRVFGYSVDEPPMETIDIKEGDKIEFGNSYIKVMETPGHTHGGVCFYSPENKFILTGDTLFAGNCGRTDLIGGDDEDMMRSLHRLAVETDPECTVYPGHGPDSVIKDELLHNPYFK